MIFDQEPFEMVSALTDLGVSVFVFIGSLLLISRGRTVPPADGGPSTSATGLSSFFVSFAYLVGFYYHSVYAGRDELSFPALATWNCVCAFAIASMALLATAACWEPSLLSPVARRRRLLCGLSLSPASAASLLAWAAAASALFCAVFVVPNSFLPVLVSQLAFISCHMGGYIYLWLGKSRRRRAAGLVVLADLLQITSGVVQQAKLRIDAIYFNHNSIYHCVQLLAYAVLFYAFLGVGGSGKKSGSPLIGKKKQVPLKKPAPSKKKN